MKSWLKKINIKFHVILENSYTAETEINVPTPYRNQYLFKNNTVHVKT